MALNFTLVVQMAHFVVAYFLIDRVLMRTVVGAINHDQHKEDRVQAAIDYEVAQVGILEAQKKESWQKIRFRIKENAPKERHILARRAMEPLLKAENAFDPSQIKKYRDELTNFIVQRVSHVDS